MVEHLEIDADTFIEENKGLVGHVMKKFEKRIVATRAPREEIYNIGLTALFKVYRTFDPSYGTKLSTYAVPMIEGEIRRYFRDMGYGDAIRYPRRIKDIAYKIMKNGWEDRKPVEIFDDLVESLPSTNVTLAGIEEAFKYIKNRSGVPMDKTIDMGDKESAVTISDTIGVEDDKTQPMVDAFLSDNLTEREHRIFTLHMEGYNQPWIAKEVGVSQVHISRILTRVKDKLKKAIRRQGYIEQQDLVVKREPSTPKIAIDSSAYTNKGDEDMDKEVITVTPPDAVVPPRKRPGRPKKYQGGVKEDISDSFVLSLQSKGNGVDVEKFSSEMSRILESLVLLKAKNINFMLTISAEEE